MGISKDHENWESSVAAMIDDAVVFLNLGSNTERSPHLMTRFFPPGAKSIDANPKHYPASWAQAIMCSGDSGERFKLLNAHSLGYQGKRLAFGPYTESPAATVETVLLFDSGQSIIRRRNYLFDGIGWLDPTATPIANGRNITRYSGRSVKTYQDCTFGFDDTLPPHLCFAIFACCYRYFSVAIGHESAAHKVKLMTDATGIHSWFKLRDKPEGKSRRDALIHWVKEHWRKFRDDPAMETKVREHLRGRLDFDWFGMKSSIILPKADEVKNDVLAERRKQEGLAWRLLRK